MSFERMTQEQNTSNLESLKEIIPHFYLSNVSEKRVMNRLNNHWYKDHGDLTDTLGLDKVFLRKWYKVELRTEDTPDYKYYIDVIRGYNLNSKYPDLNLDSPDVYKAGRVVKDKQTLKLFKFLESEGVKRGYIEEITTMRSTKQLYCVVSRNPVDMLFCSTHQNFTSCLNLQSEHDACFYMGLPGVMVDPNRVISFITDGSLTNYDIKGNPFVHYKYINRRWGVWCDDNKVYGERMYPQSHVGYTGVINEAYHSVPLRSMKPYKFLKNRDKDTTFIYMDNFGVRDHNPTECHFYYTDCMRGDYCTAHYNYQRGFENLDSFKTLNGHNKVCCSDCDGPIDPDNYYTTHSGDIICEDCYTDHYGRCERCECIFHIEDLHYIDGNDYCESCRDRLFTQCDDCGDYHSNTITAHNHRGREINLCQDCLDNGDYVTCEHCDDVCHIDIMHNVGDVWVCEDCLDANYSKCSECGEYHRETFEIDSREYCESCRDDLFTECDECGTWTREPFEGDFDTLCESCRDSLYTFCPSCNTYRHNLETCHEENAA